MKALKRFVGRTYLRASGWQIEGDRPEAEQYVLIAAPHTTNWDLPYMLAISYVFDIPISWAGKHTLFKFPYGGVMKALGGIPIVRSKRGNRVEALADLFEQYPKLVLAMPAEGTRSRVEHWKSGFYHIARAANVPIVCAFLDYERRRGGFGPTLHPTGDMGADMDRLRAFYEGIEAKYPSKFGPVRLRDEKSDDKAA